MAGTNAFLSYLSDQVKGADTFWNTVKTPALAGTLKWDDFFQASSKFWVGAVVGWWGLWPFTEGTPVAFGSVGSAAPLYLGTPIAIASLPAGKVPLASPLFALRAANPAVAGNPAATLQPDGTLTIDVNGLANITAGDVLLVVAYYLIGGAQQTIALLLLNVI